jgi:hypothetical protein
MGILAVLLLLSILCVVLSLIAGLISFAHPGGRLGDNSDLYMRLRVISQGMAVVLIGLLMYFSR